jgi:two-component system OmpR family response regulator
MSGEGFSGGHETTSENIVRLGNLTLDLRSFRLSVEGEPVEVTYYEFELLRRLASQVDHVLSYTTLATGLWGRAGRKELRNLNVVVHRLRQKVQTSSPYVIETVRGRGYGLLRSRNRSERRRMSLEPSTGPPPLKFADKTARGNR